MGICYSDARLMWNARCAGASFETVLTIGRQAITLHPSELAFFRNAYRKALSAPPPTTDYTFYDSADRFFRDFLGATTVSALDYSPYDGADVIHDLNTPVPAHLVDSFDAVIDGGSLEHVFNFPTAIASLMRMVRVGGRVFMTTPANNLCGHGMYQFSPELMFRVFSPENGFELIHLQLVEAVFPSVELTRNRTVYEVRDPAQVQSRVSFITRRPVMMMVEAKKTASVPLFARPPLQSDYVSQWEDKPCPAAGSGLAGTLRQLAKRYFRLLPHVLQTTLRECQMRIRGYRQLREYSLSNKRHFRRL
jgi:SAM-dependent methyltransferase